METDGKKGGMRYRRDVEGNGVGEGETTRGKLSLKIWGFFTKTLQTGKFVVA